MCLDFCVNRLIRVATLTFMYYMLVFISVTLPNIDQTTCCFKFILIVWARKGLCYITFYLINDHHWCIFICLAKPWFLVVWLIIIPCQSPVSLIILLGQNNFWSADKTNLEVCFVVQCHDYHESQNDSFFC